MISSPKVSGATIAYHLRHHKAIERNLFLSLLKQLNHTSLIELRDYRYVGFGAAFLEDFKMLHSEFAMAKMDCIEASKFVQTRQSFNKPYHFINLFPGTSTEYITSSHFKQDSNQVIWWDFAMPRDCDKQLRDAELTGNKVINFDILKFTFNCEPGNFGPIKYSRSKKDKAFDYKSALERLKSDETFKLYVPETITEKTLENDLSSVLRSMCMRAVRRGIKQANPELNFYHLCSFTYADGQRMTTITGIVCKESQLSKIIKDSGLNDWPFYQADTATEIIPAIDIAVPAMTVAERVEIDKNIHNATPTDVASAIQFRYGESDAEHQQLIDGYCKFYRYLPYFSRVIY